MKQVYPILLTPVGKEYAVFVPDFGISTQGHNLADAIDMARDAICMKICYEQDQGVESAKPSELSTVKAKSDQISALVDIDINAYRRAHENRTVRKNLTLPSWLNEEAEEAGINFSQTLQEALKEKLNIQDSL